MKRSQRKRQRQIAEHNMKPKNGDGRWVRILRGQNPSEQRRNAKKKKQKSTANSRQEPTAGKSQLQARDEQGDL